MVSLDCSVKTAEHMSIRVRLKEIRESRGLSQNDLARKIGQSNNNIQRFEQKIARSITWETLNLLCEALNCQPGDLIVHVPDSEDEAQSSS
jgi:putative transcriptional regulator